MDTTALIQQKIIKDQFMINQKKKLKRQQTMQKLYFLLANFILCYPHLINRNLHRAQAWHLKIIIPKGYYDFLQNAIFLVSDFIYVYFLIKILHRRRLMLSLVLQIAGLLTMMYAMKNKSEKVYLVGLIFLNSSASFVKNTLMGLAKGHSGFAVQGVVLGNSLSLFFWNIYSVILLRYFHIEIWKLFFYPMFLLLFLYPLFKFGYQNLSKNRLTQIALQIEGKPSEQ